MFIKLINYFFNFTENRRLRLSQSTFAFRDPRPSFAGGIQNVTVNVGRDATLECPVNHLGRYKVSTNLKKWLFQSNVHQLHTGRALEI